MDYMVGLFKFYWLNSSAYQVYVCLIEVEVWTQFATTGNPGTAKTPGWLPVAKGNSTLKCINFNAQNTFIDLPESDRVAFWDNLWPVI